MLTIKGIACALSASAYYPVIKDILESNQTLIAIIMAGIIGFAILWFVTLVSHQIYSHKRDAERRRLRYLQKRFGRYGIRPRVYRPKGYQKGIR